MRPWLASPADTVTSTEVTRGSQRVMAATVSRTTCGREVGEQVRAELGPVRDRAERGAQDDGDRLRDIVGAAHDAAQIAERHLPVGR